MEHLEKIDLKNKELGKLIEFAYDLRQDQYKMVFFPTYEFYKGSYIMHGAKTENGGIFVQRCYPNHSTSAVLTTIGGFEGKAKNPKRAYMFQTTNKELYANGGRLELRDDEEYFEYKDSWLDYTDEEKVTYFVDAMEMFGFKKEDVIKVLLGEMKAEEAYENVAPEHLKKRRWVNIGRRQFVFDGNIAVGGNFGSVYLDEFPFPFEGQPILDCSKVNISCAIFGENKKKVKLINIGSKNPEAIHFTDLRTAIIEEPVDLSSVDARNVIFGRHVVLYPEMSKAPLSSINLALAIDSDGHNYLTDENGVLIGYDSIEYNGYNVVEEDATKRKEKDIKVCANADNNGMALSAREHNADGIGLVRTENIFYKYTTEELINLLRYLDFPDGEDETALSHIKELMAYQLDSIIPYTDDMPITIRLLDFRIKDISRLVNNAQEYYDDCNLRGAEFLLNEDEILDAELQVIFNKMQNTKSEVRLLIPMVEELGAFNALKRIIKEKALANGITNIKVGAMIENKESAIYADEFAKEADFLVIGTNDLTESITGLSRDTMSPEFRILTDELKRTIEDIVYKARAINPDIEIGICGEHGNYPENVLFYRDLNIDYLTCDAAYIETNKSILNSERPEKRERK